MAIEEPKYAVSLQEGRPRSPRLQLDFTGRYDELCRHCGVKAIRKNPGVANDNGSIETANGHIWIPYRQPP